MTKMGKIKKWNDFKCSPTTPPTQAHVVTTDAATTTTAKVPTTEPNGCLYEGKTVSTK